MKVFEDIHRKNLWGSPESASGPGAEVKRTRVLVKELPRLFYRFGITSMLDIPCGDFNWMKEVDMDGVSYIGADVVPTLVNANKERYPGMDFRVLNAISDDLPRVDLILCRDMMGHLTTDHVQTAIRNFERSGSAYLLATCFTHWDFNSHPKVDGGWRPINLMIKPFLLNPIAIINEQCQEGGKFYNDKCMALFRLDKMRWNT